MTETHSPTPSPTPGPTQAPSHVLDLRDVSVTYRTSEGPLPAVRGIDLTVAPGEVVGLAGESGCGKSTLVSTVLRLQPTGATVEGEVLVLGEDVQTISWGRLRALRWAGASIEVPPEPWRHRE